MEFYWPLVRINWHCSTAQRADRRSSLCSVCSAGQSEISEVEMKHDLHWFHWFLLCRQSTKKPRGRGSRVIGHSLITHIFHYQAVFWISAEPKQIKTRSGNKNNLMNTKMCKNVQKCQIAY